MYEYNILLLVWYRNIFPSCKISSLDFDCGGMVADQDLCEWEDLWTGIDRDARIVYSHIQW